MVLYSHLFQNFPQFIVIHTVKGFDIVNKAEIDVFLELSCFFHGAADVGNLISAHRLRLKKKKKRKKEFSRHTLFLFPESLIISIKLLTAYLLLKYINFHVLGTLLSAMLASVNNKICKTSLLSSIAHSLIDMLHIRETYLQIIRQDALYLNDCLQF